MSTGQQHRPNGHALTLTGYAAVFDTPYPMYGGPGNGGWLEVIDRHAFDKTLSEAPNVHLLIDHEGGALARTRWGNLHLSTDDKGLKVSANLDRRDPDVQRLQQGWIAGDMNEMSWAGNVKGQRWNGDAGELRLTEIALGDVSVVTFGCNAYTTAHIRGAT